MKELLLIISALCGISAFLLAGTLCVAPYFSYRRCKRLMENGRRTEGEIIMLQVIGKPLTNGPAMYRMHIGYTVGGREYTAELPPTPLAEEENFAPYVPKVGERMGLLYDEKRPQSPMVGVDLIVRVQLETYRRTWMVTRWIATALAAGAVSAAIIILGQI